MRGVGGRKLPVGMGGAANGSSQGGGVGPQIYRETSQPTPVTVSCQHWLLEDGRVEGQC